MARRKHHSKKRKHHSRRRGVTGLPKDFITDIASAGGGAFAASMVAKAAEGFVPDSITDPKIKEAVPPAVAFGVGCALVYFGAKNDMMKTAGLVMAGISAANVLKVFVPAIKNIIGEDASSLQEAYELQEMLIEGGQASSLQENPGGYSDYQNQY